MPETKDNQTKQSDNQEPIEKKYSEIRESVLAAIAAEATKSTAGEDKKTKQKLVDKKVKVNSTNKKIKSSKDKKNIMIKEKKDSGDLETKEMDNKKLETKSEDKQSSSDKNAKKDEVKVKQQENDTVPERTKVKSSSKFFKIFTLSILFTILLIALVLGGGIYVFKWQQPVVKKIVSLLPWPAGFYNYQPISLKSYWEDIATLNYFYNNQVALGNYKEAPPETEIKNIVWDRLVNMMIVEDLAKKYQVAVAPEEVSQEIDTIVNEAGSREALADNLYEFYQWDIKTFADKVIGPYLLEQKVWEKISSDPVYDQAAQSEAQQVLTEVKENPDKFAEIAKRVSDDPGSAERGGDLGYFNQGVMVPEFEQAAFNLQVGEISDLVKTQFGYHIIKLDDKTVSSTDPSEVQIKASHILIAPASFAEILEKYKQENKIIRLLDK